MRLNARRAVFVFALVSLARAARAQASLTPPPYGEYRVDAIDGRHPSVQAGAGLTVPMGIYVRVTATGGIGPEWRDNQTLVAGRTDIIARFLLDPFRQTPVALSMGGGVSVPYERGVRVRPLLTAVIDVEGRSRGRVTPAIQVGLGGGARLGVALRTSVRNRR
jgi:hypothetical protein